MQEKCHLLNGEKRTIAAELDECRVGRTLALLHFIQHIAYLIHCDFRVIINTFSTFSEMKTIYHIREIITPHHVLKVVVKFHGLPLEIFLQNFTPVDFSINSGVYRFLI